MNALIKSRVEQALARARGAVDQAGALLEEDTEPPGGIYLSESELFAALEELSEGKTQREIGAVAFPGDTYEIQQNRASRALTRKSLKHAITLIEALSGGAVEGPFYRVTGLVKPKGD